MTLSLTQQEVVPDDVPDGVRLCRDCKWIINPGEYAECSFPVKRPYIDLVTGKKKQSGREFSYCSVQRDADWLWARVAPQGRCGRAGRWYEPKAPKND